MSATDPIHEYARNAPVTNGSTPHECPFTFFDAILIAATYFVAGVMCGVWWFS